MRGGTVLILGLLLGALSATSAGAADPQEAYHEGNVLYQNGDFAGAVAAYEEVLAGGVTAPELEYNLANAYLKENQVGKAILHYRRALRLDPTSESARANIDYARSLTQDVKPEDSRNARWTWIRRFRLGPQTAAALLFLAFTGFCTMAGLRIWGWKRKAWTGVLQGTLGGLALLLAAALVFEWTEMEGHAEGVILASEVEVHAGPADTYTVSFRLHEGTEAELLRESEGWVEIRVSDRLQGWVRKDTLAAV